MIVPGETARRAPAALDDPLVEYFGRVRSCFQNAVRAVGGSLERSFRLGGRNVRLRFAGTELAPFLLPSLEHLEVPLAADPDLTICIWDGVTTGVTAPPPGQPSTAAASEQVFAAFDPGTQVLDLFDRASSTGICWVRDSRDLPPWAWAGPLRAILSWWAAHDGSQMVHGAAVGLPDGGILLAAPGGSGKSTTALACVSAGWLYLGDDYVLLRDEDELALYSVYSSAKLVHSQLRERLPGLARAHTFPLEEHSFNYEKAILLFRNSHRKLLAPRLPLRAIVVPRVSPTGRISLSHLPPAAVLRALAPTTIFQLPQADESAQRTAGAAALRTMSRLVQRAPGYALEVGPDLDQVVAVLHRLVSGGAAA